MIGFFAGRGDTIVAMALALVFGFLLGWWLRGLAQSARAKWNARFGDGKS